MANWKKIITSGSNAHLANISASGNISASRHLFFSASETNNQSFQVVVRDQDTGKVFVTSSIANFGGGGGGSATQILLGESTTGNLNLSSNTNVQDAIDSIDTILGLLAPSAPPNLSTLELEFVSFNFTGYGTNGNLTSSITNVTTQFFQVEEPFFNGDEGTLTAFSSSDGGTTFGVAGTRDLTTDNDTGLYINMSITADGDPYEGQTGTSGFYKQLSASLTTSFDPSTTKRIVKMNHSITGETPIFPFFVDNNNLNTISEQAIQYISSINGSHFQSGIEYLGNDDSITGSYKVVLDSSTNFLNSSRRIGSIDLSFYTTEQFFTLDNGTTWNPGDTFNITQSIDINDNLFKEGSITLTFDRFKPSSTTGVAASSNPSKNFLIDSKQENEIKPDGGANLPVRVKSGTGQFPTFGTGTSNFGDNFVSSTLLTATDNYELRFANEVFLWPSSTNYSNYIPPGPNYSSISGDDTSGFTGRRYVTFKLGEIDKLSSLSLEIKSARGFTTSNTSGDSGLLQQTHDFYFALIVLNALDNSRVTQWMDVNAEYTGGDPTNEDGDGCLTGGTLATNGNLLRNITFGSGGTQTGVVYVRMGWNVSAGTTVSLGEDSTSNTVRRIKCVTLA